MCEISISDKRNNITACQMLTNLCVLLHSQMDDRSSSYSACSLLKTITDNQIRGREDDFVDNRPGWLVMPVCFSQFLGSGLRAKKLEEGPFFINHSCVFYPWLRQTPCQHSTLTFQSLTSGLKECPGSCTTTTKILVIVTTFKCWRRR